MAYCVVSVSRLPPAGDQFQEVCSVFIPVHHSRSYCNVMNELLGVGVQQVSEQISQMYSLTNGNGLLHCKKPGTKGGISKLFQSIAMNWELCFNKSQK